MPTLSWMQKFAIKIDKSIKEARSSLLDMFQIIDQNKNNEIDFKEFQELFAMLEFEIDEAQIQQFFKNIDVHGKGTISYDELVVFINEAKQ